jgi:signal transduction histidine kinase
MHGGTLDIQSEPGKGTTVTFTLALRQEGAASGSGSSVYAAE